MKRDPNLVRNVLLRIEACPYPNQYMSFKFKNYAPEDVTYHILVLQESGMIEAEKNPYSCFDEWSNVRLTWHGHEFIELARDETRWRETLKHTAQISGGGINFSLLEQLLRTQNPSVHAPRPLGEEGDSVRP